MIEWVPLKRIARLSYGSALPAEERVEGKVPVVGSGGIGDYHNKANVLSPGIIVGRKGSYGSVKWLPVESFAIDTAYFLDRRSVRVDMRWLYYALQSVDLKGSSQDVGVPGLSRENAHEVRVPWVQDIHEQRRIADFLDVEVARIEALVELRGRQSEVFAERSRQQIRALVSGTEENNGDARLVPWLGKVADGWPLVRLNRLGRFYMGTTFPHQYQGVGEGEFPFVKVADFSCGDAYGWVLSAENWIDRTAARELRARIVPAGSVVYARVGAALLLNQRRILGRNSVVDDNVRAIKFHGGDSRYWMHLLSFVDLAQIANPGPVPSVSESQMASLAFPSPSHEEQVRISNEIDYEIAESRKIGGLLARQISLLEERKRALITAAVTGQIDVTTARGADLS
ncbi:restriction endonuclease subunit S [Nocardiopsis synnemataformans]|uniref:restriction endonuclease subunit S n=1 Tax=Nocardiopsis synnemataformans TaxID=61305 RepID=UPI003EB7C527